MGRDEMRAADTDRQAVADKLRVALDEGRLDLHEYDERLQRAYAAKTYGELDGLLADLPTARLSPSGPVPSTVSSGHATVEWLGQVWSSWASVVSITTAIWLVSSLASHDLTYFWPIWVAGPWGAVLLWHTIGGLASGQPRRMVEERERKALAQQRKAERKAEAVSGGELPVPTPRQDGVRWPSPPTTEPASQRAAPPQTAPLEDDSWRTTG